MANKVVTNKTQYKRMIELLQERPDIAQGFTKLSKEEVTAFWDEIKQQLNSLGPPVKDASTWRKVWLDWKAYIKRKLVQNKKEGQATGGGPNKIHTFSDLEEAVIKMTGLLTSTNGIQVTQSFGLKRSLDDVYQGSDGKNCVDANTADVSEPSEIGESASAPSTSSNKPQNHDPTSLLREQIKAQREFYEKSAMFWERQNRIGEEISTSLRQMNSGLQEIREFKKKKLEECQRHNKVKEELLKRKIELKLKIVQMHESKCSK